ncbi:uncharacterized protein LOC119432743 isoform X2 [Dermacentor silvarum]|uniref:uncharacterized protein LOC119432743 isoform X2 n=1 Tax=Dermacentor silvarum TaxID=543639 RepID=UPI0021016CC4|nr:uncharacterized protein LOC119432743 isoform X2 [Dermacentor silvarum]
MARRCPIVRTPSATAELMHNTSGGGCPNGRLTFELVTGYVYSAPSDTIELKPGTLQLTDCLEHCRRNASCQSVNFETGLCVLFTSSATERPASLAVSQFPVFTLYAQKICLFGKRRCSRDWAFERVTGYTLRDLARKRLHAVAREECMDLCLDETEFQCRSANFDPSTGECAISDMDRHSVVGDRYFVPSGETNEYLGEQLRRRVRAIVRVPDGERQDPEDGGRRVPERDHPGGLPAALPQRALPVPLV